MYWQGKTSHAESERKLRPLVGPRGVFKWCVRLTVIDVQRLDASSGRWGFSSCGLRTKLDGLIPLLLKPVGIPFSRYARSLHATLFTTGTGSVLGCVDDSG